VSEVDDTLPVLAEDVTVLDASASPPLVPARRATVASLPAVQAAAAAAGGFVAGAAVVGLVGRRQRRSRELARARTPRLLARRRASARTGAPAELLQIVGSRSVLLDVHLLGGGVER
jgi:hypothetical protein